MGVRQIVYSSLATKKMLKSDLYMILRQARLNNEQRGVTGILIFSDGYFFQVLEGEENIVSDLYKTISGDDRHSDIQLLLEEGLEKRSFPDWGMAYATPSAREMGNWAGLRNAITLDDTLNILRSEKDRVRNLLLKLLQNPSMIEA
jgi:hypothetical protein